MGLVLLKEYNFDFRLINLYFRSKYYTNILMNKKQNRPTHKNIKHVENADNPKMQKYEQQNGKHANINDSQYEKMQKSNNQ